MAAAVLKRWKRVSVTFPCVRFPGNTFGTASGHLRDGSHADSAGLPSGADTDGREPAHREVAYGPWSDHQPVQPVDNTGCGHRAGGLRLLRHAGRVPVHDRRLRLILGERYRLSRARNI